MADATSFIEQFSDEDIEHYGVKGMQWGVRKAEKATYRLGDTSATPNAKFEKAGLPKGRTKYETPTGGIVDIRSKTPLKPGDKVVINGRVATIKGTASLTQIEAAKSYAKGVGSNNPFQNPKTHKDWLKAHSVIDVSQTSTQDLAEVNRRLQLETTFAQLSAPTPKQKSWVRKNAEGVLTDVVKAQATARLNAVINGTIGAPSGGKNKKKNEKSD